MLQTYWNTIFKVPTIDSVLIKVSPDLQAYVTDKAMAGIFYQIGLETEIRGILWQRQLIFF